jgi:hypothetical protein
MPMTKYGKIPYGSPEHILLEAAKADKKGLTPSVKLDDFYGGYSRLTAVVVANLLLTDKEDTLFGRLRLENKCPCSSCVYKDTTKIYEGDCIIPDSQAKEYFKFPKRALLRSKIAGKEVGHYCKYAKQITNDFAI